MSVGFTLLFFAAAAVNENMAATTNAAPTEAQDRPGNVPQLHPGLSRRTEVALPMLVILNPGKNIQDLFDLDGRRREN